MAFAAGLRCRCAPLGLIAARATGDAGDSSHTFPLGVAAQRLALIAHRGARATRQRPASVAVRAPAALAASCRGRGCQPQPARRSPAHAFRLADAAARGFPFPQQQSLFVARAADCIGPEMPGLWRRAHVRLDLLPAVRRTSAGVVHAEPGLAAAGAGPDVLSTAAAARSGLWSAATRGSAGREVRHIRTAARAGVG